MDRARRELGHGRPAGRPVRANAGPVVSAEARARAVSRPEALERVDLGLRYLTGLLEAAALDDNAVLPSVVMARVGASGGLTVVLSHAHQGRLGWFSARADGSVALDSGVGLEDLKSLAEGRWSAWPALVDIGDVGEETVLLNLEQSGPVSVEGPQPRVGAVLCSVLVQLASSPWSDEMLAGLFAVGDCPLKTMPGVQEVPSSAAFDLAERLDSIATARSRGPGEKDLPRLRVLASEGLPNVAVVFPGTPEGALRCLAEAAAPKETGVSVVGAGPVPGARWRLRLGEGISGCLEGELWGCQVSYPLSFYGDSGEAALLSEAVGSVSGAGTGAGAGAGAPGAGASAWGEPSGTGFEVPGDCAEVTAPEVGLQQIQPAGNVVAPPWPEPGQVEICVLGPVAVVGGDLESLPSSRRMAALGLLTYLASHRRPVSADELGNSLWPLDISAASLAGPQRKTVMNVISRARAVVGYGAGGSERVVYSAQGYRLSADVTCDWDRFERYVSLARGKGPEAKLEVLRKALELVRGEPFSGYMSSQFFEWVASEHLDLTLAAAVVDVAQDLGETALGLEDYATVKWAVDKGLQLEPTREELFRLWMHALGRTGRPVKVDEVYRRLKLVLRQRLHPLQEPQPASREVWRAYTAVGVPVGGTDDL